MKVIIKKQAGESVQQLLSSFKRETLDDPGLEAVKQRELIGYQKPSVLRYEKRKLWAKESRRLRRKAKRARGILKK